MYCHIFSSAHALTVHFWCHLLVLGLQTRPTVASQLPCELLHAICPGTGQRSVYTAGALYFTEESSSDVILEEHAVEQ